MLGSFLRFFFYFFNVKYTHFLYYLTYYLGLEHLFVFVPLLPSYPPAFGKLDTSRVTLAMVLCNSRGKCAAKINSIFYVNIK